jgi:dCTP deaminase
MSIKSDNWIRRMCTVPDIHAVYELDGVPFRKVPLLRHGKYLINRDTGSLVDSASGGFSGPDRFEELTAEEKAKYLPMISPFEAGQVKTKIALGELQHFGLHAHTPIYDEKIVSYGTSSYGYDLRCSNKFKIFTNVNTTVVDPKNFDEKSFVDFEGDVCTIPPNSFALASSVEYLRIPRNILTICLGKSTYARCGIIVNVTPLEPEWEGHVTLEFSNTTPLPAKIYANEGVAQVLFLQADETCETSYKDRAGKYMGQEAAPVVPKV